MNTNNTSIKNILVINSSLNGQSGNSNKAAVKYLDALSATQTIEINEIDLNAIDLPHLSTQEMTAWGTAKNERDASQVKLAAYSDSFIDAMFTADEIVLAVPMYNFGIPSTLKAFFDRIARAGITFSYTENGPKGLINDKKVTVLAARGGHYQGTPLDTQTDYIKNFLAFLGMTETSFLYIEGLAMGEESAKQSWDKFDETLRSREAA